MRPGVDPKVDYAFKRVFGSEDTKDVLLHLLNAVLAPPAGREVTDLTLTNPFTTKMTPDEKLAILDIKARDASGRRFNVEMQMVAPPAYPQRALYYWAKLYTEQLEEGQDFHLLCPTISITFMDNRRFPERAAYHHIFRLRDQTGEVVLSEDLAIHFIELPKFALAAEALTTPLEVWCYFLRHGEELDTTTLPPPLAIPAVRHALEVLTVMTQNDIEREIYEGRIKARRDRSSELRGARQEGVEEGLEKGQLIGIIQTYEKMLRLPRTSKEELYALPIAELEALAQQLEKQASSPKGE